MTKPITADDVDAISEIWVGDDDDGSHVMPMEFTDEAKRWMRMGLCFAKVTPRDCTRAFEAFADDYMPEMHGPLRAALVELFRLLRFTEAAHGQGDR